jgi:hypothetical protein
VWLEKKPYLAGALASFFTGAPFFTSLPFLLPFAAAGLAAGLEAGLAACFVDCPLAAGCCFTTGEAKEMPPKRRAPARIKLNFFMTFDF